MTSAMTSALWNWIEAASCLLAEHEREAVLGDLAESGEGFVQALQNILGLAARRQLELWTSWRPWAASFGLALPASLFLMGNSVAASHDMLQLTHGPFTPSLAPASILRISLVLCWAWMAGFSVAILAKRTLWASVLACAAPCFLCLSEWPGSWTSSLRLLIFLAPAIWGVRCGLLKHKLPFGWAALLSVAALLVPLMWSTGGGSYGLGLLWPGFFLMAKSRETPA